MLFGFSSVSLVSSLIIALAMSQGIAASSLIQVIFGLSQAFLFPLIVLFLLGLFFLGMADSKIVTSAEGIEFHQFGCCCRSSWGNIARIDSFQSGAVSAKALYFYQPAQQFFALFPFSSVGILKMIPLYLFRFDVDSGLGQALRLYRPNLFNLY